MKLSKFKNRLVKNFLSGLAIGLGILTSALLAVAVTGTFNTFSSGQVVKASDMNTNFVTLKTAIESIPNWTKNGTTAVYNDGNITVNGKISSANLGLYCGATASSYNGNIGGYTVAKSLCVTACGNANAHMCTAHELSLSLQQGIAAPGAGQWYSGYVQSWDGIQSTYDCSGWTSNSSSYSGSAEGGTGNPWSGSCNTVIKISCCL